MRLAPLAFDIAAPTMAPVAASRKTLVAAHRIVAIVPISDSFPPRTRGLDNLKTVKTVEIVKIVERLKRL
jgi:hypothetical protein